MADVHVESVNINPAKTNFTSVTESPVTDPALGNKASIFEIGLIGLLATNNLVYKLFLPATKINNFLHVTKIEMIFYKLYI